MDWIKNELQDLIVAHHIDRDQVIRCYKGSADAGASRLRLICVKFIVAKYAEFKMALDWLELKKTRLDLYVGVVDLIICHCELKPRKRPQFSL